MAPPVKKDKKNQNKKNLNVENTHSLPFEDDFK